jgi:hypothetical protein
MQLVTLAEAKLQLEITFSSRDTAVTQMVDGVEAELLAYIGVPTKAAALALGPEEMATVLEGTLKTAVLCSLSPRSKDSSYNILTPAVRRMLSMFVVPAVSAGSTD